MKRYISMFLMIIICFILQTSVFSNLKLTNIMPNLLIILTAASGCMYGRGLGMFTGFFCGLLADLFYGDIIGISIFIFVLTGYAAGMSHKLYIKEDLAVPLTVIAFSDLVYGFLYYICFFLLRGRLDILSYIMHVMIPEMFYTIIIGIIIYNFMRWLEEKMYPPEEIPLGNGEQTKPS